jgi:hypothetical protein
MESRIADIIADELGMEITVLHFPPGTSKWNKIECTAYAQLGVFKPG